MTKRNGYSQAETNQKQIRDLIIENSRNLFAKYGYQKTTITDIARSIHKDKSSIYYYYKNKEEIFAAVVEDAIERARDSIAKALVREANPMQKLKTYIFMRHELLQEWLDNYGDWSTDFREHFALIEAIRERYFNVEKQLISAILDEGKKKGQFNIKNIEVCSDIILRLLKGFDVDWISNVKRKLENEYLESLVDIIFHGIV